MVDGNKGENLSYHLNLRHVGTYGSNIGVTPNAGDSSTATATAPARTQTNDMIYVQEAIAYAKVGENGTFAFGRSGLELNQGQLVSKRPFDDNQVAFDGLRYVHDADWGRLGLSYSVSGKGGTGQLATTSDSSNRIKFTGVSYTLKNTPEALSNVELHYVKAAADGNLRLANGVNTNATRTWIGLNLKGEMAGVDYTLNAENFKGEGGTEAKATMIDLNVGYRMPNVMDSRVYLVYHTDGTTDDGVYDALYYDDHKYSGLMDVVKWGNLSEIALGYTFKPTADCEAGVSFHQFSRVKNTKTGLLQSNADSAFTGSDDAVGTEIDVFYNHKFESGMFVNAELGSFSVGDYMKTNSRSENITRLYVETGFDF